MIKIDFELIGFGDRREVIAVNGRTVSPRVNKNGNLTFSAETDGECVLEIYRAHRYVGEKWILWNLLFFIISVFGIFDERQKKRLSVAALELNIFSASEERVTVWRQDFTDGGKFASVVTKAFVVEKSNVHFYDEEARRKQRLMKRIKILTVIALAVLSVVLITVL